MTILSSAVSVFSAVGSCCVGSCVSASCVFGSCSCNVKSSLKSIISTDDSSTLVRPAADSCIPDPLHPAKSINAAITARIPCPAFFPYSFIPLLLCFFRTFLSSKYPLLRAFLFRRKVGHLTENSVIVFLNPHKRIVNPCDCPRLRGCQQNVIAVYGEIFLGCFR